MRPLTRNERVLLGTFVGLLVVLVLLVVFQQLRRVQLAHEVQVGSLRMQLEEVKKWASEAPLWEARAEWLRDHAPGVWEKETSEAGFVQELQKSVAEQGITILNQRLAGSSELGGFYEISVGLTLKGPTENLVRWLHGIQQPGLSQAVRQVTIRADGDKQNLRAEVLVSRFLRVPGVLEPGGDGDAKGEERNAGEAGKEGGVGDAAEQDGASGREGGTDVRTNEGEAGGGELGELGRLSPLTPPERPRPVPSLRGGESDGGAGKEGDEAGGVDPLDLVPNPVLPVDDRFDPLNPDGEPVGVPPDEAFERR